MTAADNKEMMHRYFSEVWDRANPADPAALRRFLSPSFRRHLSPLVPPLDVDAQIERLAGIRAAFPDINFTIEDMVAEGDRVVTRATLRGTHLGEFAGIPPTGREVTVTVLDVMSIEAGHFAEQWGGPDVFDLVRQLGATVTGA